MAGTRVWSTILLDSCTSFFGSPSSPVRLTAASIVTTSCMKILPLRRFVHLNKTYHHNRFTGLQYVKNCIFIITGRTACYHSSADIVFTLGRFFSFHPAMAMSCIDQGEILEERSGPHVHYFLPNFNLNDSGLWIYGSKPSTSGILPILLPIRDGPLVRFLQNLQGFSVL